LIVFLDGCSITIDHKKLKDVQKRLEYFLIRIMVEFKQIISIRSLLNFFQKKPEYSNQVERLYWFGSKNSLEQKICHELEEDGLKKKLSFVSIRS
jgi:hypothetical protein